MKGITKILTGAAAAAALTATMAAPAQAQSWDRRDRDGIDVGDIVTGVAVIGGIAAILGAFDRDDDRRYDRRYDRGYGNDRYGYDNPQAFASWLMISPACEQAKAPTMSTFVPP